MKRKEIIKRLARITSLYERGDSNQYAFSELLDLVDELEAEK